ncbi:MAG: sigma-70 family RNA polymerase sigma factor [Chloroflexi bacterium]|nr:sigma-70 family RNA polymerase sigma factor [Chloroflexota bacterium]
MPVRKQEEIDLEDYVRRAQKGDREAVAVLYQVYVHRIYRYISARVGDPHDVEDLTGQVFLNMVSGLRNSPPGGPPFTAWLYKIATARVADFYRSRSKYRTGPTEDHLVDPGMLPEEDIQQQQLVEELRKALNTLSEDQQLVLMLRFVERKSHSEVADMVGRSVPAVKSLQHRALVTLTELLGSREKVRHYLRGGHD